MQKSKKKTKEKSADRLWSALGLPILVAGWREAAVGLAQTAHCARGHDMGLA